MIKISVTSISSRGAGEEIDVTFLAENSEGNSEKNTFTLSSRQYLALGITKGETDTEIFDAAAYAAQVWAATKRGVVLLGYGAVSPRAMKAKLVSKGFDKTVAEDSAKELVAMGLMNPAADASELARKCVTKLWGKKRITSELYEKGYSSEAVANALNFLDDMGVDFAFNCSKLIEKRYGELPADPMERKKLFAALCRYGYSTTEIKQAMELYKM